MASHETPVRGWVAFAASTVAVLYAIGFLIWGLTAPAWNGYELLTAQSLVVAVPMWLLLRRHCSTGGSGRAAEVIAAAFMLWAFLGGFSISYGTFPAAVLLLIAVLAVPRGTTAVTPV